MKTPAKKTSVLMVMVVVAAGVAFLLYSVECVSATPPQTNSVIQINAAAQTNPVAPQNVVSPPSEKIVRPQLTGAELYSINCNRCHAERYPTERTAAQWKTIMLHMQVRANLPVSQAKLILKYLQENSGR